MARLSPKQLFLIAGGVVAILAYLIGPGSSGDQADNSPASQSVVADGGAYLHLFRQFQLEEAERMPFTVAHGTDVPGRNPFVLNQRITGRQSGTGEASGDIERERGGNYLLSGILWDIQEPAAVINDTVVGVGSQIGKYRVARITEFQVLLRSDGDDLKLELPVAGQ